ncbi:MAG: glycosyl hydrolase family 28-related protein [Pirellulales bacterium]
MNELNVADFGAVGNGTTDDTTALQNAIDQAGNGGTLRFPRSKLYRITSTLSVPYDYQTWDMIGASILVDFSGVGVRFGSFTTTHFGCRVYGGGTYRAASISGGFVSEGSISTYTSGDIGWQWLNQSRYVHKDYTIYGFNIGQQLLGSGVEIGAATLDSGTDTFTLVGHGFTGAEKIYIVTSGGSLPGNSVPNQAFYIKTSSVTDDTFQVVSSSAGTGTAYNFSSNGSNLYIIQNAAGCAYGHLVPMSIQSCKTSLSCYADLGGWCNENAFFGAGRFGNYSNDPDMTGGYCISLDRSSKTPNAVNNNKFFGICLENAKTSQYPLSVKANCYYCMFDNLRYEGGTPWSASPHIMTDVAECPDFDANIFMGGDGLTYPAANFTTPGRSSKFFGSKATIITGGTPNDPTLIVQDLNSVANVSFAVRTTGGINAFFATGEGRVQMGTGTASKTSKLFITNQLGYNGVQSGITLIQSVNCVKPALDILQSNGASIVYTQRNVARNSIGAMTAATDDTITVSTHGLSVGDLVFFTNSGGALPGGLTAGTPYYVKSTPTTDTFTVSTSWSGGTVVDITSTGSGTHTAYKVVSADSEYNLFVGAPTTRLLGQVDNSLNESQGAIAVTGSRGRIYAVSKTAATPSRLILGTDAGTAAVSTDQLAVIEAGGYDATGVLGRAPAIIVSADGTWSSTSHPTKVEIGTVAASSTTFTTRIAILNDGKMGFFGATPVAQQAGTGEATGFTAGSGTGVNDASTFTGNVGSTAYRVNDIVKALKNLGFLTA